jgi:hypothetical protein
VNFIVTATIAGAFWVAFFTRLVWVRRSVYLSERDGSSRGSARQS